MKKPLIIGGQGQGVEMIFLKVTEKEHEKLLLFCEQQKRLIQIQPLNNSLQHGYISIYCEKDIYYKFKGLPF